MTLPTPGKQYRTKAEYDAEFTAEGSIGTIINEWGDEVYGNPDGIDDNLKYTAGSFFDATNTSGITKMTLGLWMNIPSGMSGNTANLFTQRSANRFTLLPTINPVSGIVQTWKGVSNASSIRVDGTGDQRTGTLKHYMLVWDKAQALDKDKIKHYIDKVNVSNSSALGGSSDWPATFNAVMRIFAELDPATSFQQFECYRHKVWFGKAANQTEVIEEYDAEIAARSPDVTGNILSTIYPEVFPDNGIVPSNIIT